MHIDLATLVRQSYELNNQGCYSDCVKLLLPLSADLSMAEALRLNLVVAQIGLQQWQEAEQTLAPLLTEINSLSIETQRAVTCNQAIVEQHTGRIELAAQRLEALCGTHPHDVVVLVNAAVALAAADRLDAAEATLTRALESEPTSPQAMRAMANCLQAQGRSEEEIIILRRMLAHNSNDAQTHTNLALSLLRSRRFEEGWQEFEHRPQSWNLNWLQPDWIVGDSLEDRSVAVIVDEGIGDAIMFSPMLEQAAAITREHVIYCDSRLINLLRRTWPKLNLEAQILDDRFKTMQTRVRLGSLTNLFRSKESDFPRQQGFLKTDPGKTRHWHQWLQHLGPGPWVGIAWAGGRHDPKAQRRRSIPLETWEPLLTGFPAQWICLQHEPDQDELEALEAKLGIRIHQIPGLTQNIDEMASLTRSLNAVVSCEQTAVHVAGGVGTRCLALLSRPPGWRYIPRDPNSPCQTMLWYESVTLMEKQEWQAWQPVQKWLQTCT